MLVTVLLRRLRGLRQDDGAALAAALGIMIVGMLLTAVIAASVVAAYGRSTITRASVESRAAAEAGIAVVRASLVAGTCADATAPGRPAAGVYESLDDETPAYSARVYTSTGSGWSTAPGCPANASTRVRVVATGEAASGDVRGGGGGESTTLEAILSATVPTDIVAAGPAVYAYGSGGFGGGGRLVTADGTIADVVVRTGNVTCNGGASSATNLVVAGGNLTMSGGCAIAGTAWASGTATIDGGATIQGNIRAGTVVGQNGTVNGRIHSTGDFRTSGWPSINGPVTARNATIAGGAFRGDIWVYGSTTISNGDFASTTRITTRTFANPGNRSIPGGYTQTSPAVPGTSAWEVPPAPVVPEWIDFDFDPALWTGFTVTSLGSDCGFTRVQAAVDAFGGQPGVLDARGCSSLVLDGGKELKVRDDLAIIGNSIRFGGGARITMTGEHRVWLINPDTVDNAVPTPIAGCNTLPDWDQNKNRVHVGDGFTFSGSIEVMIYSPCRVSLASDARFSGQVFAAEAVIAGGANITYAPVGLPGYDLETGLSLADAVSEANRKVESIRTIVDP